MTDRNRLLGQISTISGREAIVGKHAELGTLGISGTKNVCFVDRRKIFLMCDFKLLAVSRQKPNHFNLDYSMACVEKTRGVRMRIRLVFLSNMFIVGNTCIPNPNTQRLFSLWWGGKVGIDLSFDGCKFTDMFFPYCLCFLCHT